MLGGLYFCRFFQEQFNDLGARIVSHACSLRDPLCVPRSIVRGWDYRIQESRHIMLAMAEHSIDCHAVDLLFK